MTGSRQGGNEFAGKIAIVTGGASGIGRALGVELVRRGAHVTLADVDGDLASAVANEIDTTGRTGSVASRMVDVSDADAMDALVAAVVGEHGRLDLMFNNAGISVGGPTHEMHRSHWDRSVAVNLGGVINGVRAAYPQMIEQGHGHIVNTASGAGLVAVPLTVPYTTTKFAVVGLSTALRPEAATHGVRVSALCPGAVETPILNRSAPSELPAMPAGTLTGREFMKRLGTRPMAAARFAPRALRGVARNQAIITVPASTRALWYLQRLSPRTIERLGAVIVRRAS
jgi:NAD(P)-dependent dehydrogenase (short-subunit alcohol dehydrogenase family)